MNRLLLLTMSLTLASACSKPPEPAATESPEATAESATTPSVNPLKNAYFGETHMHTALSLDAYLGGTGLMPSDAYRFAKGEVVEVLGEQYQISKPLDFAAVTDHAEYIGEAYSTIVEGAPGYDQDLLVQLRGLTTIKDKNIWFEKYVIENNRSDKPSHPEFFAGEETIRSAWQINIDAAEEHNEPGVFTALIGFEWSGAPKGGNLHRNVIYRDNVVPDLPVSYIDINREDGLWDWMEDQEANGIKALAIPHNSNASKLMMFSPMDAEGNPIDLAYARQRARFEPLVEIMQIKGNSEVHRNFWQLDEFANFENADSLENYSGRKLDKRNFVRHALIEGLAYDQKLGANPYPLGFVGGTDNHKGMPSDVEEYDWNGAHGLEDGSIDRRRTEDVTGWADIRDINPGALTGVWATQNTREAIWDAMRAKETFATSGPRIKVRFFGGVELPSSPTDAEQMVKDGYDLGVPMGGVMQSIGAPPTFTVAAMKDPDGANLDRIQIIKGWVDAEGNHSERIVNVAWSDERALENGELPSVGNTVNTDTASYENSIGSTMLIGSWTDDGYEPEQYAVYYARVLEIPTPRWTTYDAVKADLPLLDDVPASIQERAWSSPIWVRP